MGISTSMEDIKGGLPCFSVAHILSLFMIKQLFRFCALGGGLS